MSVEHLIVVAGGVIGVIGAAWKLFVEFDQWRRSRGPLKRIRSLPACSKENRS
jgi:hypothetical protein